MGSACSIPAVLKSATSIHGAGVGGTRPNSELVLSRSLAPTTVSSVDVSEKAIGGKCCGGSQQFSALARSSSLGDNNNAAQKCPRKVDYRLPFTEKDLFKLQASWKAVHRSIASTGIEMFMTAFQSDPTLMRFFFQSGAFTEQEALSGNLRENKKLLGHAEGVMSLIDMTITGIRDIEKVCENLKEVSVAHLRYEGFSCHHFWRFEEPFLAAVKLTLGDRYSEYIAGIYQKIIKFVISEMEKSFAMKD